MGCLARGLALTAVMGAILICQAASAAAERRVALVIGNGAYRHISKLDNPTNDARLMAETLRALGFTLVGGGAELDLSKAAFDTAVQRFGEALQNADVGLFYYAGHGLQVRGANYLVPIDAIPVREADVDFQMLDANLVLRQMESAGTRLNIVILDACRNNPFGGRGLRSAAAGLAQMQAPEGTLISFATQPGNVALDGKGNNSPFSLALAQTIRKPGLGIFDTFNQVGLAVKRRTGGAQQPWVSSSPIAGSFYFAPPSSPDVVAAPAVVPPSAPPSKPAAVASAPSMPPASPSMRAFRVVEDVSQGILNMRTGAGTNHPLVASIPAGASDLQVGRCRPPDDGDGPDWCEVRWRGHIGWASSCCMVPAGPGTARTFRVMENVSRGILNMRTGPGTGHRRVVSIPAGATGLVLGRCRMPDDGGKNRWCEVEWRGHRGWASACCMVDASTGARAGQ
jgi:uncharacterized protein YraI